MSCFRKHKHQHQATAVQHQNGGLFGTGLPPTTVVLFRCSCSDVDTKTIPGRWTLAQIRGEQETADGE